jgi:hypothetical protein
LGIVDSHGSGGLGLTDLQTGVLPFRLRSIHTCSKNPFVSIVFACDAVRFEMSRFVAVVTLKWGAPWSPVGPPGSATITRPLLAARFLLVVNGSDLDIGLIVTVTHLNHGYFLFDFFLAGLNSLRIESRDSVG